MKKYLEIYVGSRGYLEGVEMKEFLDIEKYLENEKLENLEGMFDEDDDEDYREEEEGNWNWDKDGENEIYYLGLGDEEVKYFVGVEEDLFKDWSKNLGVVEDWNKVDDKIVYELLNKLVF
jgi:hypothetical protein